MGLDMCLKAKIYIKDWSYQHPATHGVIPDNTPAKKIAKIVKTKFPVHNVEVDIAYWRKANAIHAWFVNRVQNGVDECQQSHVSTEQLQELVDLCKEALSMPYEEAVMKLTPTAGFFFGPTDDPEFYREYLQDTVDMLTPVLEDPESREMDFYYQSSW